MNVNSLKAERRRKMVLSVILAVICVIWILIGIYKLREAGKERKKAAR